MFGIRLLFGDRHAATAIEYALIAAGISLVIITALDTVGKQVTAVFTQVATMV